MRSATLVAIAWAAATNAALAQDFSGDIGDATLSLTLEDDGLYLVELQYDSGSNSDEQYLSIGVGQDGTTSCGMGDSSMVVGRLCTSETCADGEPVQMYEPTMTGVEANTNSAGTLANTSITRDGTVLTLSFVADMIGDVSLDDVQCVIWAAGDLTSSSDNDYLAYHGAKKSANNEVVFADLGSPASANATQEPTAAPTTEPTAAPSSTETAGVLTGLDGGLTIEYELASDTEVQITMSYAMSSGWIAIALSSDGSMIGSRAVFGGTGVSGLPAEVGEYEITAYEAPSLYDGETSIQDTSVSVEDGVMQVTFTTDAIAGESLDADGAGKRIIFAVYEGSSWGPSHGANFGDSVDLVSWSSAGTVSGSDAKDLTAMYLAHGIMMILAFGFLFPLGTLPSALRHKLAPEPRWFHFHRAAQTLALLMALAAFAIAIYFVDEFSGEHFTNTHERLGLAVIIVTCLQPFFALFLRKGKSRSLWRISHYLFALFIFVGGIVNSYLGIDDIEGYLADSEQTALEALTYIGTAVTAFVVAIIFVMFAKRGYKSHDNHQHKKHASSTTSSGASTFDDINENPKSSGAEVLSPEANSSSDEHFPADSSKDASIRQVALT
ncbi:Cytochrome b561 and DOMON domain-containing protein At3g61750 [Hondaea fermentalgiana]|uniref:Cytochrome b561 and DOMON domain-containing protein At3g61750 n=1 Tax=Hondaea fermentalgiana TaxID=2315210 RepID=A0A2R5G888_9STRA|nr:Cytochrome b561 and DOMON domain-containing protein At3g61750 [Hondaea fermentalgiana]|eukprot:GBG27276.1 Cytochrome b561 and DOMON domain-containing protein At3g61750 [Hondaea fermentalgiana]